MSARRTGLLALTALVLAAALVAVAVGRGRRAEDQVWEEQIFAMDTVMTLTAYGPGGRDGVEEAVAELRRLEGLWSLEDPDSELSRLNAQGGSDALSPDTAALLERAVALCRETGGRFDPTVCPLTTLWGFRSDHPRVPAQAEIDALLPLVDGAGLALTSGALTLEPGQALDLGGIAKGYAAERVMEIFRAHGVTSGMVSLGGNVQVLGTRPDGTPWRVGLRDPAGAETATLGVLPVEDRAVVTSGGYERYFEADGTRYVHILDPRTGWPAQSDLLSATVVAEDGTLADAFSTALYVMGGEEAVRFWAERPEEFDMVLVTRSGEVWATPGVAGALQTQTPVRTLSAEHGKA